MSLQTPPGSEIRRGDCGAMPRRRGGMDVAHVTTRRMPAVKPVGKPDAGNPHVRFDERGGETGRASDTAPLLDSTVFMDYLLAVRLIALPRFAQTRICQPHRHRIVTSER